MKTFTPIEALGGGHIALKIYEPGEWFDDSTYNIFVGGCGVGRYATLDEAQQALYAAAIETCERRVSEALKVAAHYNAKKQALLRAGTLAQ